MVSVHAMSLGTKGHKLTHSLGVFNWYGVVRYLHSNQFHQCSSLTHKKRLSEQIDRKFFFSQMSRVFIHKNIITKPIKWRTKVFSKNKTTSRVDKILKFLDEINTWSWFIRCITDWEQCWNDGTEHIDSPFLFLQNMKNSEMTTTNSEMMIVDAHIVVTEQMHLQLQDSSDGTSTTTNSFRFVLFCFYANRHFLDA